MRKRLWGIMKKCTSCHKSIPKGDTFCVYCGSSQNSINLKMILWSMLIIILFVLLVMTFSRSDTVSVSNSLPTVSNSPLPVQYVVATTVINELPPTKISEQGEQIKIEPTYEIKPTSQKVVPTKAIVIPDPSACISIYYGLINDTAYQDAWLLLTDDFIQKNNSSGFSRYREWWSTVKEVQVLKTVVVSSDVNMATLDVELAYYMNDGKVDTYDLMRFEVRYDASSNEWRINDALLLKGTR